jgi:purine-binding chemotaxis protein CheW
VGGVLNYRGRVIAVVDGRARLGLAPRDPDLSTLIVVLETGGCAGGVLVDEALGVVALPGAAVPLPEGTGGDRSAVLAVARTDERLVLVLDSGRLCEDSAGIDLLAAGLAV